MRILAIRGARLSSLAAPFEIDLTAEPLRSAGVFAIVGPTGAGKSSLLDALCLALFDTTPRLLRAPRQRLDDEGADHTARDARTLVRRGARDAYAEVDFMGVDGRRHRARWFVERARTGKLKAPQLSVRELDGGTVVSGNKGDVLATIEQRLGAGLVELRRAVLLPQGEIAAFLDAPADERALLLERLTGAELFGEVSKVVHERATEARARRARAEAALAACAVLPESEIERHAAVATSARLDAARAEDRVVTLSHRRDRAAAIGQLRAEEQQARAALDEVEAQLALAELARSEVDLVERVDAIAGVIRSVERSRDAERHARSRLTGEEEALGEVRAVAEALGSDVVRLEREAALSADRAATEQARRESDRQAHELAVQRASEAARLVVGEADVGAAQAEASSAMRALHRWETALDAARRATTAEAAAIEHGEIARGRIRWLGERASELRSDEAVQVSRLDEARRAHETALVARSFAGHRADLAAGEPCPLCGSCAHAPELYAAVDTLEATAAARVASLRVALDRTRAAAERARAMLEGWQTIAETSSMQARAAAEARADAERERDEAVALLRESVPVSDGVEAVRVALDARIRASTEHVASIERARAAERETSAKAAAHDAASCRERRAEEAAMERVARDLERVRVARAAALDRIFAIEARRASAVDEVARAAVARDRADHAMREGLAARNMSELDVERARTFDRDAIARARADLQRLDHDRGSARARVDERHARRLEAELAVEDTALVGEALDDAIARERAIREEARRREAMASTTIEREVAMRETALALALEVEKARPDEARWAALDALVGSADGRRFRAHAQAITLEHLVAFANAELSQLAPRYALSRAPSAGELALVVIDRDDGDLRRSVQSLSGGESFLVSLALALGLAAMTAAEGGRGTLRESSLFLDEGLGALDPDSLEIALGALEALRASGRQIGIVTHVPQVAERFAARVEVVPRGPGASDVRVVCG